MMNILHAGCGWVQFYASAQGRGQNEINSSQTQLFAVTCVSRGMDCLLAHKSCVALTAFCIAS
eukprot:5297725-Pleurochrysis_carterae.AAC.3